MSHNETTSASGVIIFTVDKEPIRTSEHVLTVGRILELSGNTPVNEYYLIEFDPDTGGQTPHRDLTEPIAIHLRHKFAAVFLGGTPVS